jgi:hypothetical protein
VDSSVAAGSGAAVRQLPVVVGRMRGVNQGTGAARPPSQLADEPSPRSGGPLAGQGWHACESLIRSAEDRESMNRLRNQQVGTEARLCRVLRNGCQPLFQQPGTGAARPPSGCCRWRR